MAVSIGKGPPRSVDEAKAQLAEVLPSSQSLQLQMEHLQELQDAILVRSLNVVDGAIRFAEIDKDATEPPLAWIEELGEEQAMIRFRTAKAAWEGNKTAPVALKMASSTAVGIMRAKAQENSGPRTLNLEVVQMSAPVPQFPEQIIDSPMLKR